MLNGKVAIRYALAAVAAAAAAWRLGGWAWLLLWLAVALAAQAAAYAGWGALVFRKSNGRLPWAVRILLAPYMICARITLYYYCRGLAPYAEVVPGVWIGRRLNDTQAREIIERGVTAALDLTTGFPESPALLGLRYCNIQLLPLTVPTLDQLREAVRFVEQQSRRGTVYVHGALGYSRSVGVVAAYLLASGVSTNIGEAIERVRAVTPRTLIDKRWLQRLHEYWMELPHTARVRS